MRGDSLRDLYAKTLALVGLGMLAGTGALVDYWPTGIQLPVVASGAIRPAGAFALSDIQPVVRPSHLEHFVAARRAPNRPPSVRPSTYTPPVAAGSVASVPDAADELLPEVDLREAPRLAVVTARSIDLHRPGVMLAEPVSRDARLIPAGDLTEEGFFGGAFKKTGASILRTGKKTGVSIAGAVRGLGGVVRKALPTL